MQRLAAGELPGKVMVRPEIRGEACATLNHVAITMDPEVLDDARPCRHPRVLRRGVRLDRGRQHRRDRQPADPLHRRVRQFVYLLPGEPFMQTPALDHFGLQVATTRPSSTRSSSGPRTAERVDDARADHRRPCPHDPRPDARLHAHQRVHRLRAAADDRAAAPRTTRTRRFVDVPKGNDVELEIAGRTVRITSADKVMFPEHGETKLDLVEYYLAVEEPLMRAMGGRPVLMQRFPNGATGSSFFQKRVGDGAPDWLQTEIVSTPNGTTSRALVAADVAHVAWAVNLGCLGFHVWPSRADDPTHADELRIDLDPQPGVVFDDLRAPRATSRRCSTRSAWWDIRRPRGIVASTSISAWSNGGTRSKCGPARSRSLENSPGVTPTSSPMPGGRKNAASGCSSTSTRTRRTRRCSARGRSGPARRAGLHPVHVGRARRDRP